DGTAEHQRKHANGPTLAFQRSKGDAVVIRRDAGRKGDGAQAGDGGLSLPVVIHLPYFFVPAALGDVVDVSLGDAGNAASQAGNDLVRKAVRNQARVILAGCFVVLLAQDLWGVGIFGVEKIPVNR